MDTLTCMHKGPFTTAVVRFFGRALVAAILIFLLWSLGLPLYFDLLLLCVVLPISVCADLVSLVSAVCGILSSIAIVRAFLPLWFPEHTYYREHEKYARGGRYEQNVSDIINLPHGDLAAIDPEVPLSLREPRQVHFKTDSLGYRNEHDYQNQKIILDGDSFVAGTGVDEPNSLTGVLRDTYGLNAYNIAYPSEPIEYYSRAHEFIKKASPSARLAIFIYEGNDFAPSGSYESPGSAVMPAEIARRLNQYDRYRNSILSAFPQLFNYSRRMTLLAHRVEREFLQREPTSVAVYTIGGDKMAFLDLDNSAAMDPAPQLLSDMPAELAPFTACVFFIPTKARTYREWLPAEVRAKIKENSPALAALQRSFSPFTIPVIDLTPSLVAAAKANIEDRKFVYWRDDTHWNGTGIQAAAGQVFECLSEHGGS